MLRVIEVYRQCRDGPILKRIEFELYCVDVWKFKILIISNKNFSIFLLREFAER
jgi:hypothetical protein